MKVLVAALYRRRRLCLAGQLVFENVYAQCHNPWNLISSVISADQWEMSGFKTLHAAQPIKLNPAK